MALSLAIASAAGVLFAVQSDFDPAAGPAWLIFGFEAMIIGGLGNIWGALAGGVILGIAQSIGAQLDPAWSVLTGHIVFLVAIGAAAAGPVPDGAAMSEDFRVRHWSVASAIGMPRLSCSAFVALAAAPFWGGHANLGLLTEILAYAALASLWNLLAGYAGLVSLGQQAYVGLGAYFAFALATLAACIRSSPSRSPVSPPPLSPSRPPPCCSGCTDRSSPSAPGWSPKCSGSLPCRPRCSTVVSRASSLPDAVVNLIASNQPARDVILYWIALILLVARHLCSPSSGCCALALWPRARTGNRRQRSGRAKPRSGIAAARTTTCGVAIYVAVAFGTAMIGALIFLQKARISPDTAFSINDWSAFVIFIVMIGGIGRIEGPIVGTAVFFLLRHVLAGLQPITLMILAVAAIVFVLKAPGGLWGLIA